MEQIEEIHYQSDDNSIRVKLVFNRAVRMKYYHVGKSYPIQTQCLVYRNGIIDGFSTVIKHNIDEDNPIFAYRLAARKVLRNCFSRWLRKEIWKEVEKVLPTPTNKQK